MLSLRNRGSLATVLGVVLAVGMAGSSFAASQSSGISEGLTILSSVSLSGVPASATFTLKTPGDPAVYSYAAGTWAISTNNATGLTLAVSATDVGTIGVANRSMINTATGDAGLVGPTGVNFFNLAAGSISGTPTLLAASTVGGSWAITAENDLNVAAATAPGTYSGTFTVALSSNP